MKTWVKLVLVLGGVAALLAFMLNSAMQEEAARTVKGTAVVTAVKFKPDIESSSLDETEYTMRFTAGGRDVEATDTLPGDRSDEFRAGHSFTVCYNPADPADADIELDANVTCGA